MKILTKITIVLVIVLAAGIAVAGIGFAMTGFDVSAFTKAAKVISDKDFDPVVVTPEGDFTKIIIEASSADITVTKSDGFYIKYFESEYTETHYNDDDGVIKLTSKWLWQKSLFSFSTVLSEAGKITIKVPDSFNGEIDFQTTSGNLRIDGITAGNVSLKATSGNLTLSNATIGGDASLCAMSGNIEVKSSSAGGALVLDTTSGNVTVSGASSFGSVKVDVTSGDIRLSGFGGIGVDAKTTSGNITIKVNGKYEDYRTEVRTTSGRRKVNGKLVSNNFVSNPSAGVILKASANSGNINISFT